MNNVKEYILSKIYKNLNKMLIVIIIILMLSLVIEIILIKNQKDSVKNQKSITKVVEKKLINKIIERKVELEDDISAGFVETVKEEEYIVKKGDSLYSIAKAMGLSEEVLKYNNPELNKKTYIGQKLKVFNGNYIEYTVQEGDVILSIANKFNAKVTDILRINSLQSSDLKNGMILIIKEPDLETYNDKIAQEKINSGNLSKLPHSKNSK